MKTICVVCYLIHLIFPKIDFSFSYLCLAFVFGSAVDKAGDNGFNDFSFAMLIATSVIMPIFVVLNIDSQNIWESLKNSLFLILLTLPNIIFLPLHIKHEVK